jgi:hypothetical protein
MTYDSQINLYRYNIHVFYYILRSGPAWGGAGLNVVLCKICILEQPRVYNPNTEALKGGVQLGAIGPIGLKPVLFPVDTYVLKNMVEFISPNSYRYHTTYKHISGTKVLYLNKQFFSNFTFFLLFKSVEYSWISLKNDAARWSEWVIVA